MPAPVIRHSGGDERLDRHSVAVDNAQQIKPGWLVSIEGATAVPLNAATEDATFAGIALTGHEPNVDYRTEVTLAEKCEIDIDVVSGTYTRGEGLTLSGTTTGDAITLVADAGSNTLAWAAETKASAVTRLRVRIDIDRLAKLHTAPDA